MKYPPTKGVSYKVAHWQDSRRLTAPGPANGESVLFTIRLVMNPSMSVDTQTTIVRDEGGAKPAGTFPPYRWKISSIISYYPWIVQDRPSCTGLSKAI